MKIEFVKETKWDGTIQYSTEVNGRYVNDSISRDERTAKLFFDKVLKANGVIETKKEVLRHIDTEKQQEPASISYEDAAKFDEKSTNDSHLSDVLSILTPEVIENITIERQNSSTLSAQPFNELP